MVKESLLLRITISKKYAGPFKREEWYQEETSKVVSLEKKQLRKKQLQTK